MPQGGYKHCDGTMVLVALGSNATSRFGARDVNVRLALAELQSASVTLCRSSSLYLTPCFPAGAGPDFVNAAAMLVTSLGPQALLAHLHAIEARFGRERTRRWGARTLDIDLLAHGGAILPDLGEYRRWRALPASEQMRHAPDKLILPHPRIQDRAFVLVPLAEIAPQWQHPVDGRTPGQMLAALPVEEARLIRLLDGAG